MARLFGYLSAAAGVNFWLDVGAKATVLLLAAIAAAALLSRSSAALRHRVWSLSFAALLLLPGLSAALPKWRLAVLPAQIEEQAAAEANLIEAPQDVQHPINVPARNTFDAQAPFEARAPATLMPPALAEAALENVTGSEETLGISQTAPKLPGLATLWLLGAAAAVTPLLIGSARMLVLRRRARPIADDGWTALLDELCLRLGLARRIDLLETDAAVMPMTWGLLRPVVLLPSASHNWTAQMRRIVLLHELAHVMRCDVGFQLLARFATALYWFHPLAWYALRRVRIERELACDDCVVHTGERASDYAAELLEVARRYRPVPLAAAIAMAQRSNLEHRIRALFDRACSHLPLSARTASLLMAGTIVLATAIAAVRLAPRANAEDNERDPATSLADGSAEAASPRGETTVDGVVLDPAGKALPGARVYVRSAITEAADEPHTSTVTDANGRFQLSFRWPQLDERIQARPDMLVVAVADGYAADWEYLKDKTPQDFTLRLRDEQALEGRIINAEGKPLAGVELSVKEIARYQRDVMEQVLDDAEQGRTISRWYKDWRYGPLPGQPARVTTDADGRFRMAGLAADTVLKLHVRGAGIRHTTFEATTATRKTIRGPAPLVEAPFPPQAGRVLHGSRFDYVAEPARTVQGVVRDRISGRPAPGVKVHCWNATTAEATTDESGRYILEGCGKQPRNVLSVDPPSAGPAYFPAAREIVDTPGLEPLVEDIELVKGIELSGRILDNDSGRPLVADVSYAPIHLNVHVDSLFEHEANLHTHSRSQPDGSFRIVVAPGPGVVSIGCPSVSPEEYLPMRVSYDDLVQLFEQSPEHRELARSPELKRGWPDALPTAARGGWTFVSQIVHARTVLISPDEQKRPEPMEVRLIRGRTLQGRLIAPDGQLPAGATAYGLDNGTIQSRLLSGADFTVTALAHGESREICFHHQKRKLGAFRKIAGDEAEPLAVRLVPDGGAQGRVLDEQGDPVEGLHVWFYRAGASTAEVYSITDAEGRFRTDNLIADQPYEATRSVAGGVSRRQLSPGKFTVGSGQTHDLGDLIVRGRVQTVSPQSRPKAAAGPAAAPTSVADATATTLRGRVLDPERKPILGAKLYLSYPTRNQLEPQLLGTSDAEGRFEFRVDTSKFDRSYVKDPWKYASLTAAAKGYGFERSDAAQAAAAGGCTLQLVKDVPIHGRILTLEGKPATGAKVKFWQLGIPAENNLDAYIEAKRSGRTYRFERLASKVAGVPESADVDEQGRFTLEGFGAERLVDLYVEGPGIEHWFINVMTRETEPVVTPQTVSRTKNDRAYGAAFVHLAAPSRKLVGVVRERGSGKPIAGVKIQGLGQTTHRPTTDTEGRFELLGAAKAKTYSLDAKAENLPYFSAQLRISDTPGLDPIRVEIELDRGIEATGRVSVGESGAPNPAFVDYLPLLGNPQLARLGKSIGQPCSSAICDANGRYTIPVLPGPGVLCYRSGPYVSDAYSLYMSAYVTIQEIDEFYQSVGLRRPTDVGEGLLPTAPLPVAVETPRGYNRIVFINPSENQQALTIDAQIPIGRVVKGTVLDSAGLPHNGAEILGLSNSQFEERKLETAQFEVTALNPRQQRILIVRDRVRNTAAYRLLQGDEPGPIELRLQPCGALVGRLLDKDGEPLAKTLLGVGRPSRIPAEFTPTTDADGRFRVEGLVPGVEYEITTPDPGRIPQPIETAIVAPGESKELGDVLATRPKRVSVTGNRPPAANSQNASASTVALMIRLRGSVLLPDGKPAPGAELYWPHFKSFPPQSPDDLEYTKRGATDGEGRFEFSLDQSEFPPAAPSLWMIAHKPGYGLAWLDMRRGEMPKDATLRLAEDRPIRGRVIDTEGRPIAGARVRLNDVMSSSSGSVDAFLAAWKHSWQDAWSKLDRALYAPLGALIGAATDAQGRFELSGVGAEQVATVEIAAPGFASAALHVVNRPGFDAAEYNQAALAAELPQMRGVRMIPRLVGPDFEQIAEAELTIRGVIFQGADRAPVAGANVSVALGWGPSIWANADAKGRYELRGLPRNMELLVAFRPPAASNLLARTFAVKAAPGEATVDFDVELKPGVVVEGRVFDRETGRGLKSGVRFVPLAGNKFVNEPGYDLYKRSRVMESTDDDGRFRLMTIPGPGVLMAQVHRGTGIEGKEINPYRQASFTEDERKRVSPTENGDDRYFTAFDNSLEFLSIEQAVKVIDLPPEGEPFACELPVDPGKTSEMAIEDDQGKPLPNVLVAGLTESSHVALRISAPTCPVYALGADRPRRVCLLHPERRLAASLTLTGEEPQPVTVRLVPAATISGQAVDESGAPIADAIVQVNYVRESARELERFTSLEHPPVKTDAEGRFRVDNVVHGERYVLDFKQGDAYLRAQLSDDQRELKAGQTLELKGVRAKQLQ